jgi:FHA domain-containing protein
VEKRNRNVTDKLFEIAEKADRLGRTARAQDLTLLMAQSDSERIQRILLVLHSLDPGVYLVGTGPYTQGVYSLMTDEVVLGRLATPIEKSLGEPVDIFCHDVVSLAPREVSRRHAMIFRTGDMNYTYFLKDLQSSCGTYLNGKRLERNDNLGAKLAQADIISLGPSHVNTYLFLEKTIHD